MGDIGCCALATHIVQNGIMLVCWRGAHCGSDDIKWHVCECVCVWVVVVESDSLSKQNNISNAVQWKGKKLEPVTGYYSTHTNITGNRVGTIGWHASQMERDRTTKLHQPQQQQQQ